MECNLHDKHCQPCEGGIAPLSEAQITPLLTKLTDWQLSADHKKIHKRFNFKGFNKTMGFINAVAWIANGEQHHPDVIFGYNYCDITYTTHAIDGLSENDFICASKIDLLME